MATKPGDHVDAYSADGAREDAEKLRDLCNQLSDLLSEVQERIDVTEAVRNPVHDFDYPDLSEAQGVAAEAITQHAESNSVADALADALEAGAEKLEEINEEAAGEANGPDGP